MRRLLRVCPALTCALFLAMATPGRAADLTVFAAASLTDALTELGHTFGKRYREHVMFSFGASSDLARQIKAGAPADVFFSADVTRMDEVTQAGLVDPAARRDVLSNQLVIVVPEGSTATIAGPNDLTRLTWIALANPESVPAGVYARTWLTSLGLWDQMKAKVVPTLDVRAALAAVEAAHAEAGIVYATDAAISKRVRVAYRVPREQGPPIVYVLAPLKNATSPVAGRLAAFLASRDAATVYQRFGFIVLPPN